MIDKMMRRYSSAIRQTIGRGGMAVAAALFLFIFPAPAQRIVDKTVATVTDGVRTELITYSDILWEMALQVGAPLVNPTSEELNSALQTIINQRVFSLEADRLPQGVLSDEEIAAEIGRIVARFPPGEFERRLKRVGFKSVKDDNFEMMIVKRIAIERYLNFRFRSFIVITAEDETKYFRDVYIPEFRRLNPEALLPQLDNVRPQIRAALEEDRVAAGMEAFLDDAKRRVQIVILSAV